MNALLLLLRLRTREIVRTWRIWVLPIVLVFFAASGPVITRYTNELLAGALGGEAGALALPDRTAADAAAQWVSDLSQLVVFLAIIMAAGAINGEVCSGIASLLLLMPASRAANLLSHAAVIVEFVAIATLLGAPVPWGANGVVFRGGGCIGPLKYPDTPREVLDALAHDTDLFVRFLAEAQLEERMRMGPQGGSASSVEQPDQLESIQPSNRRSLAEPID